MRSRKAEVRGAWRVARKTIHALLLVCFLWVCAIDVAAHDRRTAVVETVEKAGPAVVNIRTEQIIQRRASPFFGFGDSFFDNFFNQFATTQKYRTQALGSGAIVDNRGFLVTNAHVVEKASKIFVAIPGERKEREATLIGIDHNTDLAIIKVESEKPLPDLDFAQEDKLFLGETVIAIGNPLGLENSVTTGVVSAPRRRIPDGKGGVAVFIQTDALINPGNSGGPLLDINGRLIGINTAIAEQAQGIGFAVPVEVVRRVIDELVQYGKIRPPYSGILPGEISSAMVRSRGSGGVLVTEVDQNSPAALAGVDVADVVLTVDGVQVDSAAEYLSLLRTYPPDSEVSLSLLRGVDELNVVLSLRELPSGYALDYVRNVFGLELEEGQRGVVISKVLRDSPAARVELKPGDKVVEVAGSGVGSLATFFEQVEENLGRLPLRFAIYRGNRGYLIELP